MEMGEEVLYTSIPQNDVGKILMNFNLFIVFPIMFDSEQSGNCITDACSLIFSFCINSNCYSKTKLS